MSDDSRGPCGIVVSPTETRAYVTNCFSDTVSVLDTAARKIVATVRVRQWTNAIAITPDGKYVYVMVGTPETVAVINTTDNKVTATIPISTDSFNGIAISPDGKRAYAAGGKTSITAIDIASNTVAASVAVGREPIGIAITPDGKYAYVANAMSATVSVIELSSDKSGRHSPGGRQAAEYCHPPITAQASRIRNRLTRGLPWRIVKRR